MKLVELLDTIAPKEIIRIEDQGSLEKDAPNEVIFDGEMGDLMDIPMEIEEAVAHALDETVVGVSAVEDPDTVGPVLLIEVADFRKPGRRRLN